MSIQFDALNYVFKVLSSCSYVFSIFEKGTHSTSVPNELCELCLPWETVSHQATSPVALPDVTEDTSKDKQEQHKKRIIHHPTAITYYPGERYLGRKLRCCRNSFKRSKSVGVMDFLSPVYS